MNFELYMEEAFKTWSKDDCYLFDNPRLSAIDHAIKGLITESGEMVDAMKKHLIYGKPIDKVNFIEEAGDQLWYLALLLKQINEKFPEPQGFLVVFATVNYINNDTFISVLDFCSSYLAISSGQMAMTFSSMILTGRMKEIENTNFFFATVQNQMNYLSLMLSNLGSSFDEATDRNIAKLRKRYSEKFNKEQALNRNLVAERAELEAEPCVMNHCNAGGTEQDLGHKFTIPFREGNCQGLKCEKCGLDNITFSMMIGP